MVVLIDAYNVIRFLYPGAGRDEGPTRYVLHVLAQYRQQKKGVIDEVIAVFDAGPFLHKSREIKKGIVMVHAGQRHTADDVLVEYAAQLREKALIITNDRQLAQRVQHHKASVMAVAEFWSVAAGVVAQNGAELRSRSALLISKYQQTDPFESEVVSDELDELMISSSVSACLEKEEGATQGPRGGGNSLSKKGKLKERLFKKIG